jgi:hypothetical protein
VIIKGQTWLDQSLVSAPRTGGLGRDDLELAGRDLRATRGTNDCQPKVISICGRILHDFCVTFVCVFVSGEFWVLSAHVI